MSSAITSVITCSRLCPPASSWPWTPGCHIPGFIHWMCTLMVDEAGGLGDGYRVVITPGEQHTLSEPSPSHLRWKSSAALPKRAWIQYGLRLPVQPDFFRCSWPCSCFHLSRAAWATWQLLRARKAGQESGRGCLGLTLAWLVAKHGKRPSCQAEDTVCLLVWGETGGKSRRQECLKCFLQLHWKIH